MRLIRRCTNVQCRVETFAAKSEMPFSTCPVCCQPGAVNSPQTPLSEQFRMDPR